MPNLTPVFENFQSHSIPTLKIDGEPWMLAKELGTPLGVGRAAIRNHTGTMDSADVRVISTDTNAGKRNATWVSQSGAIQLAMLSRKPEAFLETIADTLAYQWGRPA